MNETGFRPAGASCKERAAPTETTRRRWMRRRGPRPAGVPAGRRRRACRAVLHRRRPGGLRPDAAQRRRIPTASRILRRETVRLMTTPRPVPRRQGLRSATAGTCRPAYSGQPRRACSPPARASATPASPARRSGSTRQGETAVHLPEQPRPPRRQGQRHPLARPGRHAGRRGTSRRTAPKQN